MGALPGAALLSASDMRARMPPEMSNSNCHPGKAGGTLNLLVLLCHNVVPIEIDPLRPQLAGGADTAYDLLHLR